MGAVVQDTSGSVYIADRAAHVVRKVDSNGVITRIAGTGQPGYSGDNGPATSAALAGPAALALDSSVPFLYIADRANNRIRRVSLVTGIITTLVGTGSPGYSPDGTLASLAQLDLPEGICISNGFLYIADTFNHRVRRVNLQSGNGSFRISDSAGSGTAGFSGDGGIATAAQLNYPSAVAADAGGNIYIADRDNQRIRKHQPGGNITTIAGNGNAGFSGDGGGATQASLSTPAGVAVDTNNNIFIADSGNARIRKVSGGIITTLAGNGAFVLSGDGGPASAATLSQNFQVGADTHGNLYIADPDNNVVRQVNTSGVINTIAGTSSPGFSGDGGSATQARLNTPEGVAADSKGVIYIADYNNHRIRKISNGVITTFAGTGQTGYNGDNIPATTANLNSPLGLAVDSADNLYVADYNDHRIRRVSAGTNVITTIAGNGMSGDGGDNGPATNATLMGPIAVAVDGSGRVFIADLVADRIRVVAGGTIKAFAGTGMVNYSGDGGPASSATLWYPRGLSVDSDGNVFISDSANQRIRRVDSNLMISTVAGDGVAAFRGDGGFATAAELSYPSGLATGISGMIYIADTFNFRVRALSACSYSLNPATATVGSTAASGSFAVNAPGGCSWNAATTANWITITQGSGSGNGTVSFTFTANPGSAQRSGNITLADKTYTLTQSPPSPALSITKTHSGNFSRSQQNATYAVTVSNAAGASPTTGTVTVTETIPSGLSLALMAGSGWSCSGNSCSRSDALNGGSSYPAITVTVNVSASASSPQTNQVWVSGGGSAAAMTSDVTTIVIPNANPPFGSFDTPANNTNNVVGAIALTGWALDSAGVTKLELYRDPVAGEAGGNFGLIFIGTANFVTGARPDVQASYPGYPNANRAGWGYQLLTNFLPNGGNGTFKLHAFAYNAAGGVTELTNIPGQMPNTGRTITCTNSSAAKPFGTIDTPDQGGSASGSGFVNFGWALTPPPGGIYKIPLDGSGITVYLDGAPLPGHPTYNNFRNDIATLFPGYTNTGGAIGYYVLDTTKLTNGPHSIAWVVFDNAMRGEGLGSRYFTAANGAATQPLGDGHVRAVHLSEHVAKQRTLAGDNVTIQQMDRLEVHIGAVDDGHWIVDGERQPLPPGSTLDPETGIFYWQILPPFLGDYDLQFTPKDRDAEPIRLTVRIVPQSFE